MRLKADIIYLVHRRMSYPQLIKNWLQTLVIILVYTLCSELFEVNMTSFSKYKDRIKSKKKLFQAWATYNLNKIAREFRYESANFL